MQAHLEGEAARHWLIGRNGMWHGGIHIMQYMRVPIFVQSKVF